MRVPQRVIAVVALTALLCPTAYAPIFGFYPGLHSLIKQSELIAAVTILEKLSEDDFGGSARYKIQFDKLLKGKAPEKQTVAYLRYLEITPEAAEAELLRSPPPEPSPSTHSFALTERIEPFRAQSRWVAFLTKARKDVDAAYENVNCEGSTFPISPLGDLDALKMESLPDTLVLLFREYVDFKRKDLKKVEQQLDTFIHKRDE
jgi:hypothetical protein